MAISNETTSEWNSYLLSVNNTINTMWNFILYKDFCDKKVIELKEKVEVLTKEKEDIAVSLGITQYKLNKTTNTDTEINKKKRKATDLLKDEFKKVKRYKSLEPSKLNKLAKEIFNNLNSIDDIIELQYHPNKFDFIGNDKFNKLYNIIPALEELQKVIGMQNVKDKIFRSICYFLYDFKTTHEMNHIMIMGPPGVGKTTVAKIMANIYLLLGFLENDKFITATRSDLIAKYLGQTADKTQKVIDSALGGVLFIDEVYSLGNSEKSDSYAKECIDTINLNMSRIDKPWLLIVGGYKEEIKSSFLAFNKGLERRFTVRLEITGYNEKELFCILMSFIKEEKWRIENNAITEDDIKKYKKHFKYYGGDMRKLFQLAKENYCVRSMKNNITLNITNECPMILNKDDFEHGLEHFKENIKEENTSHYMMYL
jgi:SpoVK/Ycf46/Vps4 family AAA+-type ATPase